MTIGEEFRQLHQPGNPFVLMNAYDIGSAKVMEALGAQAIGTSSSGHAFTLGRADMGNVSRDEALAHAQDLVEAVSVPVSGDFENGYGDNPEDVEETVRQAYEIGLAGCSIEDTNMADQSAYDFDLAVERIKAGAAAARGLAGDFVFVARADGVMNRTYRMDEAIRRIKAFDDAGADCLYAPYLPDVLALKSVCEATAKPVNALAVGSFAKVPRSEFAKIGIARISLGSGIASVTHGALIKTAREILNDGDFSSILEAAPSDNVEKLLAAGDSNQDV